MDIIIKCVDCGCEYPGCKQSFNSRCKTCSGLQSRAKRNLKSDKPFEKIKKIKCYLCNCEFDGFRQLKKSHCQNCKKECKLQYDLKYRDKNKDKRKIQLKKYKEDNKGKCDSLNKISTLKRRGQIKEMKLSDKEKRKIQEYYEIQQELNLAAKSAGSTEIFHVDHIKPLSKGGKHHPDNLSIILSSENLFKNNKNYEEMPEDIQFSIDNGIINYD